MALTDLIRPVEPLRSCWDFVPSRPSLWLQTRRMARGLTRWQFAPAHEVLKAPVPAPVWIVYFIYAPDGLLSDSHRFTLGRLKDMGLPLLIVQASERAGDIPAETASYANALIWKGLSGYDFSAYSVALHAIASHAPGATTLVLNDSVLGPFVDLRPFIDQSPWDMLGFTASSLLENHVQSYAFVMRDVTPARLETLSSVLPLRYAYSAVNAVLCQETRLARIASRSMSVGACWYAVHTEVADPTLVRPAELLAAGFPFMKKSILIGRHVKTFQPDAQDALRGLLRSAGHPAVGQA